MTDPDPDLNALTELERAATPAPWRWPLGRAELVSDGYPNGPVRVIESKTKDVWPSTHDAKLIAALRNSARALIAAARRAREYENSITWETTCLACPAVLDSAYAETVRAEKAEAERDALRAEAEKLRRVLGEAMTYGRLPSSTREAARSALAIPPAKATKRGGG